MFICPICKTLADNFIVDKEHYNCSCRRLMIILNTYDINIIKYIQFFLRTSTYLIFDTDKHRFYIKYFSFDFSKFVENEYGYEKEIDVNAAIALFNDSSMCDKILLFI